MIKDFIIAAKNAESAKNLGRCPRPPKAFATFAFFAAKKLFAIALITLCSASANALPLVWRADWPDAKPVETLVHRGTDIELRPLWRINKEPADTTGWTFTTYCQTNAVGPWFGPMPGAFFSHTNDVGAASYNVIVRAQTPGGAVNYTAFARLRMLDSPGFAPGELPLPAQSIDFADVTTYNAPWLLPDATNDLARTGDIAPIITNTVTKQFVESLGIDAGTTNYADLANKPAVNGVTLAGDKTAAALGLADAEDVSELAGEVIAKYTKPQGGIPASDMAQAVQTSLGKANTALQTAPVTSVNNKTGAVVLTASDVGAKPTQTAVSDPYENGFADEFISNIRQTTNGVIIPAKKKVNFSKVATHALPLSLPEQFFPVDVWVPGGGSDLYVTIRDPSLLTVVPNETGGGPYMLQYYNPDPDAEDDLRGYIGLAVFDYNLEFVRTAQAGTLDFGGHNPYAGDAIYLVDGGGGLSLLGTLVQHRLEYIPLDAEAVADAYDATSTYSVGDLVTHGGRLYECNTAISSPEAWNATHWTEKKVGAGGDFSPLAGQQFDFATTQGVMDALKATIEALGGTVTNAPTPPAQNNQTQGE